MEEDAPVNSVGGGNIAGVGVGPKGEPGRPPMAMLRRKRMKFKKFVKEQGPGSSWCPTCGEENCPKVFYKALGKYVCAGKSSSSRGGNGNGE